MRRILIVLMIGILAAGCASGPSATENAQNTDPGAVVGRTWLWESTVTPVEKIEVPEPERYMLFLKDDGTVQALFDCNRGSGNYSISDGKLTFGPLISTRMACPPDSLDSLFMGDLQRVSSFFVEDGSLFLELPMDSGTMKFRQAP